MITGKAIVAQGGGPTAVINQTLVGVILEAKKSPYITELYGAVHGVRGIIDEDFLNLSAISEDELEQVAKTPSSALKSTRDKPDAAYCEKLIDVLKSHEIRYFFYIGGNDSADTCRIISETAAESGYELKVVHLPKTIDNDLLGNDHTPGFASAAQYVAHAFAGIDMDTRSLPGVYIGVVMGRDAGFLTAASALAHNHSDSAPHLIYIPEAPFDTTKFIDQIKNVYDKYGRCVIAVSEGIRNSEGVSIAATLQEEIERDSHGNVQLSGSGMLADSLVNLIKENLSVTKVRADTFGYLQRSFACAISSVDASEAREMGVKGVQFALDENFTGGSIGMHRSENYMIDFIVNPLKKVAKHTRSMDKNFYDADKAMVTEEYLQYLRPMISDIPNCALLNAPSIAKQIKK